jgi:hypothetical protein
MLKLKSLRISKVFKNLRLYNDLEKEYYEKLSFDDKVLFHATDMNKNFRQNSEVGLNPFNGYDKSWYEKMKKDEADLDLIYFKN